MRLQIKPQRHLCLPTSFAMALDIPVAALLDEVGHDGSEIVFPDLPEPSCRRGFHVQELIDVALRRRFAVTPVELFPVLAHTDTRHRTLRLDNWWRFESVLRNSRGVLDGTGCHCGHAVAYDHGHIFDPDGRDYDYSRGACEARNFFTRCAWRFDNI
jgi:hypothetical protein